jgi:hypothetical protein
VLVDLGDYHDGHGACGTDDRDENGDTGPLMARSMGTGIGLSLLASG